MQVFTQTSRHTTLADYLSDGPRRVADTSLSSLLSLLSLLSPTFLGRFHAQEFPAALPPQGRPGQLQWR